jgi:integrase
MQSRQLFTGKERYGRITLELEKDKYLRIRTTYKGKTYAKGLGGYTPDTLKAGRAKAQELNSYLVFEKIDEFKAYFKPASVVSLQAAVKVPDQSETTQQSSIKELWSKYLSYKSVTLEAVTISHDYRNFTTRFDACPYQDASNALAIRAWLSDKYSLESVRRTLVQLNACINWAIESGLYTGDNKVTYLLKDLKQVKGTKQKSKQGFTSQERDLILDAFLTDKYCPPASGFTHSHYYPFVRFLFLTGCRPEEAIAIKWKHIKGDRISFQSAYRSDARVLKGTKTGESRIFSLNSEALEFIQSLGEGEPEKNLFNSPKGTYLNIGNFNTRVWSKVTKGLRDDGLIKQFLPPNNTRHTAITLWLKSGVSPDMVAALLGTSTKCIYENYQAQIKIIDFVLPST